MTKSCMSIRSASPFGRSSRPTLRNGPTRSSFLVSIEMTGGSSDSCSWTAALRWLNWASRYVALSWSCPLVLAGRTRDGC